MELETCSCYPAPLQLFRGIQLLCYWGLGFGLVLSSFFPSPMIAGQANASSPGCWKQSAGGLLSFLQVRSEPGTVVLRTLTNALTNHGCDS